MSKSIYEEALESAKQHHEVTDMSLEIKALEMAQKQAKLLVLYRYLNENTNDYDLNLDEVYEILDQIYDIEDELNGTK